MSGISDTLGRRNGNVKICKNGPNSVVAATQEKSESCVLDGVKVRDREVGGSNPLAPTNLKSNATTIYGCQQWQLISWLWPNCGQKIPQSGYNKARD